MTEPLLRDGTTDTEQVLTPPPTAPLGVQEAWSAPPGNATSGDVKLTVPRGAVSSVIPVGSGVLIVSRSVAVQVIVAWK